jgi:hypothetical protein
VSGAVARTKFRMASGQSRWGGETTFGSGGRKVLPLILVGIKRVEQVLEGTIGLELHDFALKIWTRSRRG